MKNNPRLIRGWILVDGERSPQRSLRLRVTDTANNVLVEVDSLPDGQFAVEVPIRAQYDATLQVSAVDPSGGVLCLASVSGNQPTILRLDRLPSEENGPRPTLLTGAANDLAQRIVNLETSGLLPIGSVSVLGVALGRLLWLEGLLAPAGRAKMGDKAAAAVVREALGAWARELQYSAPVVVAQRTSPSEEEGHTGVEHPFLRGPLIDEDAVGFFASAVMTVGRSLDEQIEVADGLHAVLSVRSWLEALAMAAAVGDQPTMHVLMGAPPPSTLGIPGVPGGGLRGGGIPSPPREGFPGLPSGVPGGKPKGPGLAKVSPTVSDLISRFRSPIMLTPSGSQRCIIAAMAEVAELQANLPTYRITGLEPVDACPGNVLTINGQNFGAHGSVVFAGTASVPKTLEWTDGRILVIVPPHAGPGTITLNILDATLVRCQQEFQVFRLGSSDLEFEGGTATLYSFRLNGSENPIRVEPGDSVSVSCYVTEHHLAQTHIWVTQGGATIADFGLVAGGGLRQESFATPNPAGPITCEVHLTVSGPCGQDNYERKLTVAATPYLRVEHIEVTQGLQDAAHSVRLVSGRTTGVRAYLSSGLGNFSYTGTPGQVGNVTGTVQVERGGVVLASISAKAPVTIGNKNFADADRAGTQNALLFEVPGSFLDGDVTMRVIASVAGLPGFDGDTPGTSESRTIHAAPRGTLTVIRLRMSLTNAAHPAAEPAVATWQATSVGTQERYPLGDAGMLVRVPTTGDVLSTEHFFRWKSGWEDALADLDDYADRFDDFRSIFACVVPTVPGSPLNGISHHDSDRIWPLPNDRRCFLVQAGLLATFAHEMGHTLGLHHAFCGNFENIFDIDFRLPSAIEPGFVGWRRSDDQLMPAPWAELMSYCTPPNGQYQDRWPSFALWNILFDQFN